MSRSRSRSPDDKFKNQIYVGYLPNHATMDDVEDFFKGYGPIKTINLKPGYGMIKKFFGIKFQGHVQKISGSNFRTKVPPNSGSYFRHTVKILGQRKIYAK